jgi:uncharacterized protein
MRVTAPIGDLAASRRQSGSLEHVEHRPWALPDRAWFQGQSWFDLLFAHWRVEPERLWRVIPPQLELDVIDGSAWIGVTPFELRALRVRFTPPVPFLSCFPELNVRTYVTVGDKPGIYFLSLDAASRFAVAMARRTYRLPYFRAEMAIERDAETIRYRSKRVDRPAAELMAEYRPRGPAFNAAPGTTEAALIERYCAYTLDEHGTVNRAEIHHPPWELRAADAEFAVNTMAEQVDVPLDGDPILHFAAPQDVVLWPLEPLTAP